MNEKDDKLNKGSFLYIRDQDRAEWGYPEGYPYKEQSEHTITATVTEEGLSIDRDGVVETIPRSDVGGLLVNNDYLRIADPIDQDAIKTMSINGISISEFWDFMVQNGAVTDDYIAFEGWVCTYKDGVTDRASKTWPTAGFYVNLGRFTDVYTMEWTDKTIHPMASAFLPQATQTTYGTIKQAAAVTNVTAAPTAAEFNALLNSLRDAGILATS